MVRSSNGLRSLRFSRLEKERLLLALLFSLLAHLGIWGGYEIGKKYNWWQKLHLTARHQAAVPQPALVAQKTEPTIYLDVTQPAAEAPKVAKYYSDKNSRAANRDADVNSNQPKLTGKQRDVPKTEDMPPPAKMKPMTPEPPQKKPDVKPEETKTASGLNPGALQPAKPADTTAPEPQPKPRPRTLAEAKAQQQSAEPPGLALQQDGGVKRQLFSSLDAKATTFGAYDSKVIAAIRQRWYDLLDSQQFAMDRTGKTTVYFRLNADGSVTELKITANTVGDLLGYVCQEAIQQAAPFGAWSADMRRTVGANFREITFTFYYY